MSLLTVLPAVEYPNSVSLPEISLPESLAVAPPPQVCEAAVGDGSRLMITQIINENFKSYAGRKVLGPFDHSFTCVVGPNGSGKSNVIDSMLFVFGFRAQKIRSKKLSVLIHNSENYKNCTFCSVEVHFAKIIASADGKFEQIPDSQFCVGRTVYKDNSSSYFIDKKKVHFKQVAALLESYGIDLNYNRFLILQGEVEQISLMKPMSKKEHGTDGMLEFIEDIIGTIRFREPIEKSTLLLQELDEDRKLKLDRIKSVEKEKETWEVIRNDTIKYLKIKNEIIQIEYSKKENDVRKIVLKSIRLNELVKSKVEEKDALSDDLKEANVELNEAKKKVEELDAVKSRLSQELEDNIAKFSNFEKRNVEIFEDRKHKKNTYKNLDKKLAKQRKQLEELASQPETLQGTIDELTSELESLNQEQKEAEKVLEKMMKDFTKASKQLQKNKDDLVQQRLSRSDEVNAAKEKLDLAKVQLELFEKDYTKAKEATVACEKQIEEHTNKVESFKSRLDEIEDRSKSLTVKVTKGAQELNDLKERKKLVENKHQKLQNSFTTMKFSHQQSKSRGAIHSFVLDLKKSGNIPGIHGRLGDLGGIDANYDVAISSCCSSLEHYVVDTVESAKKCLEALKRSNIGRTTFIALEQMGQYKSQAENPSSAPLPRLRDLVITKPEYKTAFYYALRDTLVADDLQIAQRVAYGATRWRVVTIKGELIDTNGTMSGGGNRVTRGRMGTNSKTTDVVDSSDLEDLKMKCEKNERELEVIQQDLISKEKSYNTESSELERLTSEKKSIVMELKNSSNLIIQLKKKLVTLKKAAFDATPDENQKSALKIQLDEQEAKFKEAFEKADIFSKKIKLIDDNILKLRMKKVGPKEEEIENIKQTIKKTSQNISKNKIAIESGARKYKNIEKSLKIGEDDITNLKKQIEQLEKDYEKLELEASNLYDLRNELQENSTKAEQEVVTAQKKLVNVQKRHGRVFEKVNGISKDIKSLQATLSDLEKDIHIGKQTLSKYKLKEIDGEDVKPLKRFPLDQELDKNDFVDTNNQHSALDSEAAKLSPNLNSFEEFRKKQKIYLERVSELEKVTEERNTMRKIFENLSKRRLNEFTEGFKIITNKLKENYQLITFGGDAELEYIDSLDPFSEGIAFSVRPPKKSWKNICNLSGGEKTLSSLALIFALHHYRPSPLYVMDEIDAALDTRNVTIIARYIAERTKNAQFIVISLRNQMYEQSDRLIGIYKTNNSTKTVALETRALKTPESDVAVKK